MTLDRLEGDNAGDLILSRAEELGADMMVMGAYGQSRITEFVFGSATRTILANPTVPIFLAIKTYRWAGQVAREATEK